MSTFLLLLQDVYDAIIALRARAGIESGNDESPMGLRKI